MAITVGAWNVCRGLGDDERVPHIIEGIDRLDTDIVVLSEAYAHGTVLGKETHGITEKATQALEGLAHKAGYAVIKHAAYEDAEPRGYEQHVMMLSRLYSTQASIVRLATRNMVAFTVDDPDTGLKLRGYGGHFEDRNESLRQDMAGALLDDMLAAPNLELFLRTFAAGDFNTMHRWTRRAQLLGNTLLGGAVGVTGQLGVALGEGGAGRRVRRAHSLAFRLHDMADGGTMQILDRAGFMDADPRLRPTMKVAGIPVAQLDHILTQSGLVADKFQAFTGKGSDHKAIAARLSLAQP